MSNKEVTPKYPELSSCTYCPLGNCSDLGCWAQTLLENARDVEGEEGSKERVNKIITEAREEGCPVV